MVKKHKNYEQVSCAVCASVDQQLFSEEGQFGIPTHVVVCTNCGHSFLNPRWTRESIMNFYAEEYDQYYRPKAMEGYDFRNVQEISRRLHEAGAFPEKASNILAVGSGKGDSLVYLRNNHFENAACYAIEPSAKAALSLEEEDIHLIHPDVESDWDKDYQGAFDLIVMRHVLEHLYDPGAVLRKLAGTLSPQGVLYLAVPNAYKPKLPLSKSYFRVVHTQYFNPPSLRKLIFDNGLAVQKMKEGDQSNAWEIFAICQCLEDRQETTMPDQAFEKQWGIYEMAVKKESSISYKLKTLLRKAKAAVF